MNLNWLQSLPKVELHLHLEGSVEPADLRQLAVANRLPDSDWPLKAFQQKYFYSDFMGFLQTFKFVTEHLIRPEDYGSVTTALLERLHQQNVVYAEIFLSAGVVLKQGKDLKSVVQSILTSARLVKEKEGIEVNWILDSTRQFGPEMARKVVDAAIRFRGSGMNEIVAVGLGGDENSVPASELTEVYARAKDHGLHVNIHAGEAAGPSSIWEALELLGAERIGHGLAARQDERLMDVLAEKQIALECAPTSNVCTGAIDRIDEHPLRMFYDRGLRVTLNTDDPALFHTDLIREYQRATETFRLTREDFLKLNQNAVKSCFAPEPQLEGLRNRYKELAG